MTFSIFNPCTGTCDQVDVSDACDDELSQTREARIAQIRALIEDIAEAAPASVSGGLQ